VLVARPLVALVATLRTDLSNGERAFVGWVDPRGIVAAATASTFSASLVSDGVGGASDILPLAPGRLLADATGSGAELFVVHPGGRLDPVTAGKTPQPQDGDMLVLLGPVPQRPAPTRAPGSAASSRRGDDGARER
jgi:hypothetical protein